MKVAYLVTRSDTLGGAAIHVRDCARALLDRGEEAVVVAGGEGPYHEHLAARGIPRRSIAHLVGRPFALWAWGPAFLELRATLGELAPDLVSCHTSNAGFLGRLAAASLGIPAVFTAHSWAFTEGKSLPRQAIFTAGERLVAPLARRIITVSDYDRELALARRVAPPGKVVTIHNGMPDVDAELRAEPAEGPPRIVTVARLEPPKDFATLLAALARLPGRDWTLDVVGDGPAEGAIRRRVRALGLEGRVRLLGYREDVAEILAGAQLFVLASRWEGFPRTTLEAMRAGLPVVVSDVGGSSEALERGETGFAVPPEDPGALAEALAGLIDDPDRRARMGRAGRRRYEERFTFGEMFDRTLDVYRSVLAEEEDGE